MRPLARWHERVAATAGLAWILAIGGGSDATAAPGGIRVRVVGPGDLKVPGAEVLIQEGSKWRVAGRTGVDGSLFVPKVVAGGALRVAARFEDPDPEGGRSGHGPKEDAPEGVPASTPEVVVRVTRAANLTLRFVDARSRVVIRDLKWQFGSGVLAAHTRVVPIGFGDRVLGRCRVEIPPGWLADDMGEADRTAEGIPSGSPRVAPDVRDVHVAYPLRREAAVRVFVNSASGDALPIDHAFWRLASTSEWTRVPSLEQAAAMSSGDGSLALPGVAWFEGSSVEVAAFGKDHTGGTLRVPFEASPELPITVRVIAAKGMRDPDFLLRGDPRPRPVIGIGGGVWTTEVGVRVRRSDRSPAVNALVYVESSERLGPGSDAEWPKWVAEGRTGYDGSTNLTPLGKGEYRLFPVPGLVPFGATFRLAPGGSDLQLSLQEPMGATLDLVVADSLGRPVPCARVRFDGPAGTWAIDADHGTQRLDPFVDENGTRTFRGLEPGAMTVTAVCGSRKGRAQVELQDGARASLTLKLDD